MWNWIFAGRVTGGVTVCAVASGGGFGDAQEGDWKNGKAHGFGTIFTQMDLERRIKKFKGVAELLVVLLLLAVVSVMYMKEVGERKLYKGR